MYVRYEMFTQWMLQSGPVFFMEGLVFIITGKQIPVPMVAGSCDIMKTFCFVIVVSWEN